MEKYLLTLGIGVVVGLVDVLPMIKMKLDRYSISSAFVFYLIVPFMIYHSNLFETIWWIKGGLITMILAIPTIIIVAKENKKSTIPMFIMSIVLGSIIGIVGHYLNLM